MAVPLDIKINKWLATFSLIVAIIGLVFGIVSLFNDPIKNIKEYSPNTTESITFAKKATKVQSANFFKIVSSGRRSTDTIKYHVANVGIDNIILEYNSDQGEPIYSDKIYLKNSGIDAKEGDTQGIIAETKQPTTTKVYRYTTESDIQSGNSAGFAVFAFGLLFFVVFRLRYWYYKKNLDQSIAYLNKSTQASTDKIKMDTEIMDKPVLVKKIENSNPIGIEENNNIDTKKVNSKYTYAALAFFLGIFGVHKFYAGKAVLGLIYLVWLLMFIISIIFSNGLLAVFAFLYLFVITIISIIESVIALFR